MNKEFSLEDSVNLLKVYNEFHNYINRLGKLIPLDVEVLKAFALMNKYCMFSCETMLKFHEKNIIDKH